MKMKIFLAVVLAACVCVPAFGADFYMRKDDVFTLKDFVFHTGETFPELKAGYVTLGDPKNPAVLILHGTTGSGAGMLNKNFGEQLFLEGQPLDAHNYYIILTDAIGTGKSSKPSDGLRAKFPNYNYDDMVHAQYRLVTEGLGVKHLRVIIGNSMGGMQTWLWSIYYPEFMDAAVPMASMPMAMSGRNWMMRKFISYTVRNDPAWNGGDYTEQPKSAQYANVFYAIATNGGNMALQKAAPTSEKGDEIIAQRLGAKFTMDANDFLYQWESSREYNPQGLEKIKAYVLAINSADDERNPAEFGVMEKAIAQIEHAEYFLIPASPETAGHGTTAQAKWWKDKFVEFMKGVPAK
ncbi:MAG: alpha/beta fold hydrolase [Synergistaceae bacterium]|nr:alpha/beta fold hydrolase [Synergistaceae bacterium]